MDYKEKYLKYKNKYLELKSRSDLILVGGNIDNNIIEFIKKFYNEFAEIFYYFKGKYGREPKDNLDEFAIFCVPGIKILLELLYDKLSPESKAKPVITIFSYATGTGIVESLFGLYLKYNYGKEVILSYVEIYDKIELIKSYNIFVIVNNIFGSPIDFQLSIIQKQLKESGISPALDNLKRKHLYDIDIFITNNPQSYIYNTDLDIDYDNDYQGEIMKKIPEQIFITRKRNNKYLKLMKKIFDTFITQVHQNISMIWILWYPELDLSNKQSFQASLHYIATKYYEQWNIKPEFVISTIDKINKICKIPEIKLIS